jgi:uncharacterized protein (TIGR03437 family)
MKTSPLRNLVWQAALVLMLTVCGFAFLSHRARTAAPPPPSASEGSRGAAAQPTAAPGATARAHVSAAYGRLPLSFEANAGQADARVKFLARGDGYGLFIAGNEAVFRLRGAGAAGDADEPDGARRQATLRMRFVGGNPEPRAEGVEQLPGRGHYFIGQDARRWRTDVAAYRKVALREVYPGVDVVYYGRQRALEYDLLVAPGADPRQVRLSYDGAASLRLDARGDLRIGLVGGGEVRQRRPVAFQEVNGRRRAVRARYRLDRGRRVGIELGRYDAARPLVIDPVLLYSTFLGGLGGEQGFGLALDRDGNMYVAGETSSPDFPGPGPVQGAPGGGTDAFVLKLNPGGTAVVYAAWLGGNSNDAANAVAVDAGGNVFLTGSTLSSNFPVVSGPQGARAGLGDAFVAKLSASGSALLFSTYLGGEGSDAGYGVAVDAGGNAYVAGRTDSVLLRVGVDHTGLPQAKSGTPVFKTTDGAASWSASGAGVLSAFVRAVAVHPTDARTAYTATHGGLFKSTDGGGTWLPANLTAPGIGPLQAYDIALDPSGPNRLYVVAVRGVHKSEDGGASFEERNNGLGSLALTTPFNCVAVDPATPTTVYVGTNAGVFKTTNGAASWAAASEGLIPPFGGATLRVNRLVIDPANPAVVYAATPRGVYKTTNGGAAWAPANTGLGPPNNSPEVLSLAVDPKSPATLYAGVTAPNGGVFKTTDGGGTWAVSNAGLTVAGQTISPTVLSLAVDPATPTTVYAGTNAGVFRTANGGANWAASGAGLTNVYANALAVAPSSPATVYAGMFTGPDGFLAKFAADGSRVNYLAYFGGNEADEARAVAVDRDGNAYVTGFTASPNFPTVAPLQGTYGGGTDAFVLKVNAAGSALVFSTFFGGSLSEFGRGVAVGGAGQVYVAGSTSSSNFPRLNPVRPALGGLTDGFVTKLNAAGSALEYSTWLGGTGNDQANAVAVDAAGNAYVVGTTASTNFPLKDAVQTQLGGTDAFVTKLDAAGALAYSTFLGGAGSDQANAVAVDAVGNAYLAGTTSSANFPLAGALRSAPGGADAFAAKIGEDADLSVAQTASRNPVMVGNSLTYTLSVTNRGPSAATNVTLTDTLPAGVTFVSATPSAGSCAQGGGTVTCQLGALAANAAASVALVVTPNATGSVTNRAGVSGGEPDSQPGNNQSALETAVSALPSVAGRVRDAQGNGVAGVSVTLAGAQSAVRQTDASGAYQFADLTLGGSYVVSPARPGYSFEPPSASFGDVSGDRTADFTATACSYALAPTHQTFGASGGGGTITVTATARCDWTAASSADWIRITAGAAGSGGGAVTFTVAPTAAPRSGYLTVAGQRFAVWQAVNACDAAKFLARRYYVFGFPTEVQAADFNGDGAGELFFRYMHTNKGAYPTETVNPALGQLRSAPGGGPLFGSPILAPGFNITATHLADFDGDGKPDAAFFPHAERHMLLYPNDGAGGVGAARSVPVVPPDAVNGSEVFTGDLNRDGRADVLFPASDFIFVTLSSGATDFAAPVKISLGGSERVLALADVNGDGTPDLLSSGFVQQLGVALRARLGNGGGGFSEPINSPVSDSPLLGEVADFNGDGLPDLAVSLNVLLNPQGYRGRAAILYGDGGGRFAAQSTFESFTYNYSGQQVKLATGDFDGDARPELVVLAEGKIFLLSADGRGRLSAAAEVGPTGYNSGLAVGDFDGDRRADIASLDSAVSSVLVYFNRCAASGVTVSGRVNDRTTPVGVGGIKVRLSGARTAETVTDAGGNFEFAGLPPGGDYTVTPDAELLALTPASQGLTNVTADRSVTFAALRRATAATATHYSAAALAPSSIASVFGYGLCRFTATAPLGLSILVGGMYVTVKDSAGVERTAEIFFVSPNQINFVVPRDTAPGAATVRVYSPTVEHEPQSVGAAQIERVAPGVFTADQTGAGLAAALIQRVKADGSQVYEPVVRFDAAQNRYVALPVDVSDPAEQAFLLLFGTGVRFNTGLSQVSAKVGGEAVEVWYAGAQGQYTGLDQINLKLPRSLAGRGEVDVTLTVDGKAANTVRLNVR